MKVYFLTLFFFTLFLFVFMQRQYPSNTMERSASFLFRLLMTYRKPSMNRWLHTRRISLPLSLNGRFNRFFERPKIRSFSLFLRLISLLFLKFLIKFAEYREFILLLSPLQGWYAVSTSNRWSHIVEGINLSWIWAIRWFQLFLCFHYPSFVLFVVTTPVLGIFGRFLLALNLRALSSFAWLPDALPLPSQLALL